MAPCWFEKWSLRNERPNTQSGKVYFLTRKHTRRLHSRDQHVYIGGVDCAELCPLNYAPLCGTDGVTYSNGCFLSQAACLQRTEIGIQYEGQCEGALETS